MKIQTIGGSLTALALMTAQSHGAFALLDNFEGKAAGAVNGVDGWTADTADTVFTADPSNAGNMVLSTTRVTGTTSVFKAIPNIADASTGTIFFRARAGAVSDFVLGSSDVANPAGSWNNYEGYMRFTSAGGPNNIDVRNGGGFDTTGTYTPDAWYNVWLVLDNAADTTTLYIGQGTGDASTAVATGSFRNGTTDPLSTMFIRGNSEGNAGFVDDIYVDITGANLTNPAPTAAIPEPATSLLALAGLAFGMRRRRS